MKEIVHSEKTLSFCVSNSIYDIEVLHKCFYWYGDRFAIDISLEKDDCCRISMTPKENKNLSDVNQLLEKIKQDLIDFKTRSIINKETQSIRELIIAKSFANFDDSDPKSEISDPIGFTPN